MDGELDTGPMLAQATVPMQDDDFDIADVGPRLSAVGIGLLPRVLERIAAGDPGGEARRVDCADGPLWVVQWEPVV